MKNVLSIDMLRNCEVDLLANVSEDDNSLILKVQADPANGPKVIIGNEIIEISEEDTEIQLEPDLYIGLEDLTFHFEDSATVYDEFTVKQVSSLEGDLYLRQISDFHFELIVIVQNNTNVPIATNSSLGVVMGGDNVGIRENGQMYAEQEVVITPMTNSQIDEICK